MPLARMIGANSQSDPLMIPFRGGVGAYEGESIMSPDANRIMPGLPEAVSRSIITEPSYSETDVPYFNPQGQAIGDAWLAESGATQMRDAGMGRDDALIEWLRALRGYQGQNNPYPANGMGMWFPQGSM